MRWNEINVALQVAVLEGRDTDSVIRPKFFVAPSGDDSDEWLAGPGNDYPSLEAADAAAVAMNSSNPLGGQRRWIASETTYVQTSSGEWVPMLDSRRGRTQPG